MRLNSKNTSFIDLKLEPLTENFDYFLDLNPSLYCAGLKTSENNDLITNCDNISVFSSFESYLVLLIEKLAKTPEDA